MLVEVGAGARPFQAIPPEQAIQVLIAREEASLAERQRQVSEARDDLGSLVESFVASRTQLNSEGLVWRMDNRGSSLRACPAARAARERVSFLLPGDALPPEAIGPVRAARRRAARPRHPLAGRRRGGRSSKRTHWREHLVGQVTRGVQGRSHPAPPHRLVIVDGDVAILPRDRSSGALVVHGPDLRSPTTALFDAIWQASIPVVSAEGVTCESEFSDAQIRQVVALLALGSRRTRRSPAGCRCRSAPCADSSPQP